MPPQGESERPWPDAQAQQPILDSSITAANFACFDRCSLLEGGRTIRFRYPSGDEYDADIDYVLSWFNEPHYQRAAGKLTELEEGAWKSAWPPRPPTVARRCRRWLDDSVVLVELAKGEAVEVAWDTVLMACEPRYEHFGGLSAESRESILRGFARWRPAHRRRSLRKRAG